MFKTFQDDIDATRTRIGLFSKSFSAMKSDLQSIKGTGISSLSAIFSSSDSVALQKLNYQLNNGVSATNAYKTSMLNASEAAQQQAHQIITLRAKANLLNRQLQNNTITQEQYNIKMKKTQSELTTLTTKTQSLTFAQKAAAVASKVLASAMSMVANMAIAAAINAIITKITELVNAYQQSIEKIKECQDNISSLEDNISSLNDELKTNLSRLHELEKIETPTLFEQDEIDQLKEYNDELERQIRLEKYKLQGEYADANTAAQEAWDNSQYDYKGALNAFSGKNNWFENLLDVITAGGYSRDKTTIKNLSNMFQGNFFDQQQDYLNQYQNVLNDFEKLKIEKANYSDQEYDKLFKQYEERIKEYETKLVSIRQNLETTLLGLDSTDSKNTQAIEQIQGFIDLFDELYDKSQGNVNTTFSDVYNDTQFADIVVRLEGLAKAGELTEETFNKIDGIESFKQALEEVGQTDIETILNSIIAKINEQSGIINSNGVPSVTSLTDALTSLKESLEDIIGYADTYQSAMQKISAGTGLTNDEVRKVLEIDSSLFDKFIRQEDGTWSIDLGEILLSYNTKVVGDGEKAIADEKEKYQQEYDNAISALEKYTNERNNLDVNDRVTRDMASELDKKIKETKAKIQKAQDNLKMVSFEESLLDYTKSDLVRDTLEAVKNEVDDYNDEITTLNKAIDALNEGNSLSYDEMTGLVNLYPQLQDKVVKTTNGYTIEKSAIEDVRIQSYKTRNDYIDNQIAQTKAAIEQTKARMETYTHEIALISSASAYKAALESGLLEQYWNDERTIKSMEELIKLFESYKSEVLDPDNSSSSKDTISDKLQNQIDYYKMLLEAIGIVSDKVVESLEKEKDAIDQKIDALNDEKDALQEKNDEQQRELDLIEAKNNLDKAKKQKVFVYKEGQGLVQVQDEKAVADAQKEYDDIQKEIEIANIDKQIDVYDKQKEAIEDQIDAQQKYGEQFTNMESDIQDTLTVEQAKKALGTDEKGLLSLDNKTINGIRDGLATAVYNKDVEDNKENSEYVTVKLEDFLKSVGATVTPTEFKAMASTITNNPANIVPATNSNSTVNNAQIINNKTANFNATFNIYDALDPYKIIDTVKEYFNGVLKQTINSVK